MALLDIYDGGKIMKKIQLIVDQIDEELCGAKDYAECYVEAKVFNNSTWANRYKEMALDELKHAGYLHDKAVELITEIGKVYEAPQEMQDIWDNSHKGYVEKAAWVKQMLSM